MIEITLQVDETLVQTIGRAEVEKILQGYLVKLQLRLAAQEILEELPSIDLENDPQWQVARATTWEHYKQREISIIQ